MNTSKLILPFSCGKVNFSRSILLFKRGFYMSEEMEVACLLCLSDDKLPAETFWAVCQMTNRSQMRSGTRGPSASRKITIWEHLHSGVSLERVFLWIATLTLAMTGESPLRLLLVPSLNFTNSLNPSDSSLFRGAKSVRILFGRLAGGKIMDCHADARNDSLGTWVYKSFFTKIVSGGNLSKVFPRVRG